MIQHRARSAVGVDRRVWPGEWSASAAATAPAMFVRRVGFGDAVGVTVVVGDGVDVAWADEDVGAALGVDAVGDGPDEGVPPQAVSARTLPTSRVHPAW